MTNKQLKSKNHRLKFHATDRKSLILGTVIATLIAVTPYFFYIYESVPEQKTWSTFLFTYESKYYENIFVLAWTLTGKIVPLYLLLIWFFTCRHWWYHVLLIPILMYTYQIFATIRDDISSIDSNQLIYIIPFMIVIIPSIYLIRARIFNSINNASKTLQELEDELKVSPKGFWSRIKQYF